MLRVAHLEFIPVNIPYTRPEVSSQVNRAGVTDVLARAVTSDGVVGWGSRAAVPAPSRSSRLWGPLARSSRARMPGGAVHGQADYFYYLGREHESQLRQEIRAGRPGIGIEVDEGSVGRANDLYRRAGQYLPYGDVTTASQGRRRHG